MSFCLDTSFIVNYFREKVDWADKIATLRKRGSFKISIITYAELYYGALRSSDKDKELVKLNNFLEAFGIEIVSLATDEVEIYASARIFLEKKGTRIDDFDLLIAATTKANKAVLITDNPKHFQNFPGLKLQK